MWLNKLSHWLKRTVWPVTGVFNSAGVSILMVMMLLTVTDVSLRYILNSPVPGAYELTEFLQVVLVFFALAYTATRNGHVTVDLVVSRLPHRAQAVVNCITYLLGIGILLIISWRSAVEAQVKWAAGQASGVLGIPFAPFSFVIVIGTALFGLVLLVNFTDSLVKVARK